MSYVIDDDTEGYVAYYDVQDADDDAEPRSGRQRNFINMMLLIYLCGKDSTWISIFLVTLVFSLFML